MATPLPVIVESGRVRIGDRFAVSFQRTLRVPDDGRQYPLPPGLGRFPVETVAAHRDRVPEAWKKEGGVFIPMYQREALWLGFDGAPWKPNAVKVGTGQVNAITGDAWSADLHASPQDYLVCPDQPWLDGIKSGDGVIRQFVAAPIGRGETIEAQLARDEEWGGIRILVYEPKPGRFPEEAPPIPPEIAGRMHAFQPGMMGLGAGGRMKQKIYPDPYGVDVWDRTLSGSVTVHIVNSEDYQAITGTPPPPTPVDARAYTAAGLPWFDLYDESAGDVAATDAMQVVKSVNEISGAIDESIDIDRRHVVTLRHGRTE